MKMSPAAKHVHEMSPAAKHVHEMSPTAKHVHEIKKLGEGGMGVLCAPP